MNLDIFCQQPPTRAPSALSHAKMALLLTLYHIKAQQRIPLPLFVLRHLLMFTLSPALVIVIQNCYSIAGYAL